MRLSAFGEKLSAGAGILSLMQDLGVALAEGGKIMMGGGNPGFIPEMQAVMRARLREITDDDQALYRLIGIYDPPRGDGTFRRAMADLLRREYGWDLNEENICLTHGSQGAFFLLFNILAGRCADGSRQKILLPMAPEYIGYADLGMEPDLFTSVRPRIETIGAHSFKYRVDFDRIAITQEIGAICVSRPTNPTGNVLTDAEIERLAHLAEHHAIPLIIDGAYGFPFPGMIHVEASPVWNKNLILCLSLSKLGLPAVRTGIVIADRRIIDLLSGVNAVVNLAPSSFGAMLMTDIVQSGEILRLSREVVRPFYERKRDLALAAVAEAFAGLPYRVHVAEGTFFLWMWFPGLPVPSRVVYERLKARGVVVVAGEHFFPGLATGWDHTEECLRLTYSQDEEDVHQGIGIIADEIRRVFEQSQQ